MAEILKATGINKAFGGVQALKNVSLSIDKGEIHCLAGGNGSGKSTLIKIISGVYSADAGTIEINGKEYKKFNPIDAIMEGIQVIYQDLSIFPNLSVAENIALNDQLYNKTKIVNWKNIKKTARESMAQIGISLPLDEKVENLSVADKQLIAICRSLVSNAKLIIMDEPTTSLTRKEIKKLFDIIKKLQQQGVSILFVSHKLDEVFEISERFTVLRNGENVIVDSTKNVDNDKFIYYMTGRKIEEDLFTPTQALDGPAIFEVKNLSLLNGFQDINFKIHRGEILGITGLLGSGRTELAMALFGLFPADQGSILLDGKEIQIHDPVDALKNGIGYVPEDRLLEGLFLDHSIKNNVAISNLDRMVKSNGTIDFNKIADAVERWQRELSIVMGDSGQPVSTLSGGNQQKVVLAKWLQTNPRVLILNGPTVGVDVGAKFDLHNYLRMLAREKDIGIILISDDIPEIHKNCNRILVMRKGRLRESVVNTEITENELLALITREG
jgi:simple sugar transport system ATP-binding protein